MIWHGYLVTSTISSSILIGLALLRRRREARLEARRDVRGVAIRRA